MKQPIATPFAGRLLLALLLLLAPATAWAQAPWQWQMSLKIDTVGEAMYMPSAVAFDTENERYYAVDAGRSRLVSFSRDGEMLRAFTADGRLKAPFDMVRLDNGQLWVVEKGRNSLTRIDIGARVVEPHQLKDGDRQVFPDRIALAGGKLHILDRAAGMVLRLADDLTIEQRFGCPGCVDGFADFVMVDGALWALENMSKRVVLFRADGTLERAIELGDEVGFPVSLAVDSAGFIYVLDRHRNRIAVFDEEGRFRYRFLAQGQARGQVYFPRQLRFDPWGRLCVVDEGNGRVEIFSR